MQWRSHFDEASWQRGKAYAVRERASQITFQEEGEGWVIRGRVRGSQQVPYTTKISLPGPGGKGEFTAECDCPVGGDCKHAVAVIESFIGGRWKRSSAATPSPAARRPAPLPVETTLPVPLRYWIDASLGEAATKQLTGEGCEVSREVRYSFHPRTGEASERGGLGRLTVMTFAVGEQGLEKGMTASLRGAQLGEFPACFSETDLRFVQEMCHLSSTLLDGTFSGAGMQPRGRFWGVLIEELVATGRAIWDGNPKAVLQSGPNREVVPCWTPDLSSRQGDLLTACRFADSGKPAVILGTKPALYIEPETLTMGVAIWKETVEPVRWLEAPVVPVSDVGRVCERMAAAGWAPDLRPTSLEVLELTGEAAKIVPRIVFTRVAVSTRTGTVRSWRAGRRRERKSPVALFEVRYGSIPVPLPFPDREAYATKVALDAVWRVKRDLAQEERFADLFAELGLRSVRQVFGGRLLSGKSRDHAFTLPEEELELEDGNTDEAWQAILARLPELRAAGWEVEIRPDFGFEVRAQAEGWWTELEDGGTQDWFRFDAGVIIDGKRVSLLGAIREIAGQLDLGKDLPRLLEARESATIPVRLPEQKLQLAFPARRLGQLLSSLLQLFEAPETGGAMVHKLGAAGLAVLFPELANETAKSLRALGERLADFQGVARVKTPRTLKATLRGYQTDGLSWLQFLRSHGLNGILADDMGLGKTVQTLAHLLVEKAAKRLDRPCLIVAPTSVVGNWAAEAAKFAPSLRVLVLQGPERLAAFERIPKHDLVITSYALLPRDGETIQMHEYHYVILDEAQYIKNPASKMAKAAFGLRARHRLCLSGTPMENHLGELWSLFHFLMPGFLGEADAFRRDWRRPIESGENPHRREVLAKRVAPLMLRRTRNQVLQELPPRTDILRTIPLNQAQTELYEVVRAAMDKKVREAINAKGLAQSHIIVLDALLKLRQICCDPRLLKLPAARKVKESAKLESFRELVTGLVEEGRRILVFSQFTSMLELLEKVLEEERIPSIKLIGETPGTERSELVNAFQAGEVPVFFISLKAGGSGLNLTTADTVIHYDPWWNPAVEEQATGRAHRMGQANPVFVYRLITEGTIEERILELQSRKAAIASAILEGGSGESGCGLTIERSDLEMLLAPM